MQCIFFCIFDFVLYLYLLICSFVFARKGKLNPLLRSGAGTTACELACTVYCMQCNDTISDKNTDTNLHTNTDTNTDSNTYSNTDTKIVSQIHLLIQVHIQIEMQIRIQIKSCQLIQLEYSAFSGCLFGHRLQLHCTLHTAHWDKLYKVYEETKSTRKDFDDPKHRKYQ